MPALKFTEVAVGTHALVDSGTPLPPQRAATRRAGIIALIIRRVMDLWGRRREAWQNIALTYGRFARVAVGLCKHAPHLLRQRWAVGADSPEASTSCSGLNAWRSASVG
jgi:hypothetical protein